MVRISVEEGLILQARPTQLRDSSASYPTDNCSSILEGSIGSDVKLTIRFHIMLRLRMCVPIPPLSKNCAVKHQQLKVYCRYSAGVPDGR